MKKAKTYRLEESAIKKLDILLQHYQEVNDLQADFKKKISYADVLELLIQEKYNYWKQEGEDKFY